MENKYESKKTIVKTEKNTTTGRSTSKEDNEKSRIQKFLNWLFREK